MMKSIRCKTIIAKISSNFDSLYSSKAKKKKNVLISHYHYHYQQNGQQNQFNVFVELQ